jgi:kelch-like protein 10
VRGNAACRPTIKETLAFFDKVKEMTEEDRAFLTPEFARQRIPHDILFVIGGYRAGHYLNCVEAYDVRADQWIEVSSTQMY